MSPVVAVRVGDAHAALRELAAELMSRAPDAEARIAVARAADAWSAAISMAVTAAGQHPLSPRAGGSVSR